MSVWGRVVKTKFFIRLLNWEYWPFGILQLPVFPYYFYLSLRARSFVFFSASNPGITMGGLFGESKYEILKKIPARYIPKTIYVRVPTTPEQVIDQLKAAGLKLPVILKPDIGERGFMVKKIADESQIEEYLEKSRTDFLIQEFVDLPMEFGVFYTRLPKEEAGHVTSIVMKEMLTIKGDGKSTLMDLILNKDRAKLQWDKLKVAYNDRLNEVIPNGKVLELVSIGNHALGTKFLDRRDLINQELSASFDKLSKQIEGFYFGRFDLRCSSLEDLVNANVKIMELNGCGAEPAHIYQPGFSIFEAVITLLRHWATIFEIADQNRKMGVRYLSLREAKKYYRNFKEATRT